MVEIGPVNARLRTARVTLGASCREIAERVAEAGCKRSHSSVLHYESGRLHPTPQYLRAFSDALGVSYEWLLDGVGDPSVQPGATVRVRITDLEHAQLESLPDALRGEVAALLHDLSSVAGFPSGTVRHRFLQHVGGLLRAPFHDGTYFCAWSEMNEDDLRLYFRMAASSLRLAVRRWAVMPGHEA